MVTATDSGLDRAVADAAGWLREAASRTTFGEVRVTLVLHAGEVRRTERMVSETTLPDEGRGNGRGR